MQEKSILVVGSVNVDMVVKTPRIPSPGETILGGVFQKFEGGKGANQAVAANAAFGGTRFLCGSRRRLIWARLPVEPGRSRNKRRVGKNF